MNWIEVSIETTAAGIDAVCGKILSLGIEGMQIEDFEDFKQFLDENRQYWDYVDEDLYERKNRPTAVKVYLSDTPSGRDTLAALQAEILNLPAINPSIDLGTLRISLGSVRSEDWETSWKQYYKPTPIGEKLIIVPEWEEYPESDRAVFLNNPGMAFGTGTHASTRLALEALEQNIRTGDRLLDLGCGSGILFICGLLLGASLADAVDIDPNAVDIAVNNARLNQIPPEHFRVVAGDVLSDDSLLRPLADRPYDIVLANIIADVILALPDTVKRVLSPDGLFISSGIIEHRLDDVLRGLSAEGFTILEVKQSEGWASIVTKLTS